MRSEMQEVLDLQPSWTARAPNAEMRLRGQYVRGDVAAFVRDRRDEIATAMGCDELDLEIEGKDQTGYYARVPWVRFADRRRSPSPREGWYGVYLFSEDGDAVYLALIQGTQLWDGAGLRSRPSVEIQAESDRVRRLLRTEIASRSRLVTEIKLGGEDKALAYSAGTAVAYRYRSGEIPADPALESDLLDLAALLRLVYAAEGRGEVEVGAAPEVSEAERLVQRLAGRRVPRQRFRASAAERKAIEQWAMTRAEEHFRWLGAQVITDVHKSKPYDLVVELGSSVLTVEVKGSTGDGTEVLLTEGEVQHHLSAHPANALVVVSNIRLSGSADQPLAEGGELLEIRPWEIVGSALTPIAHRYDVTQARESPDARVGLPATADH